MSKTKRTNKQSKIKAKRMIKRNPQSVHAAHVLSWCNALSAPVTKTMSSWTSRFLYSPRRRSFLRSQARCCPHLLLLASGLTPPSHPLPYAAWHHSVHSLPDTLALPAGRWCCRRAPCLVSTKLSLVRASPESDSCDRPCFANLFLTRPFHPTTPQHTGCT